MPSRRWTLAAVAGGLLPTLPGCGTENTAPSASSTGRTPSTTNRASATTESETDRGESTVRATLERESYWLRATDFDRSFERSLEDDAVEFSTLRPASREAVAAAVENGQYETTDPSDELLDGIEDLSVVSYEGAYYSVSHTFPTHTLDLDMKTVPADPPDDRTVEWGDDAIEDDGAVEEALSTVTPRGTEFFGRPYTTTQLAATLRKFLDRYDYVRSPHGVGELVLTSTERPPPYVVSADEASDEELYGRSVLDLDSFASHERDLLRRSIDGRPRTPLSRDDRQRSIFPGDVPDQLERRLEGESRFVRVDGTVYAFDARHLHWADPPVEIGATVTADFGTADSDGDSSETDESSVRIELTATHTGSRSLTLLTDGVAPFGVLWAYGPTGRQLLHSPAYESAEHVGVEGDGTVAERRAETVFRTDETVSATYRLGGSGERIEPGEYEVPGLVWAKWPTESGQEEHDWRSEIYPYTLSLTVPEPGDA